MNPAALKQPQEARVAEDPAPRTTVCGACRHYDPKTKDTNNFDYSDRRESVPAACRRYPTLVYKSPNEWCGEWLTR